MSTPATPVRVVEPFAKDAVGPTYITNPLPLAPTTPGKANYSEGFPPANMTSPTLGGIPPSGADMNGILYAISSWCAYLQSGQHIRYDATASAAFGPGYPIGAVLRVSSRNEFYLNVAADNTADPFSDVTNWRCLSRPLYFTSGASGTIDDYVLPGPSDYNLDFDTTAGNATFTGFVAQYGGQRITISNTGPNLLTIAALGAGSGANDRVRAATDLAIITNQSITLQYSTDVHKWLIV